LVGLWREWWGQELNLEPFHIHPTRKRRKERACLNVCPDHGGRIGRRGGAGGLCNLARCENLCFYPTLRMGREEGREQKKGRFWCRLFWVRHGDEGIGEIWAPPHTFLLYHTLWGGGEGKKGGWVGGWVCGWGYEGGGGLEGEGVRAKEGSKATRQAGYHRYAATACLLRYSPTVPTYLKVR